jgi:hypothetical protein
MPNLSRPAVAIARNRRPHRAGWLVPAAIGLLGLITVLLILFAFGVLVGLIHF